MISPFTEGAPPTNVLETVKDPDIPGVSVLNCDMSRE